MPAINSRRLVTAGGLEWRADSDTLTLEGHASTFNQPYDMGWYQEEVSPGAFKKTLSEKPDVRLLINHTDLPLARTVSGTLELAEDTTGLYNRATLDKRDPDVQRIAYKVERGDLDQMSFAFRTIRQEWDEDYEHRWLNEVSLADGDVSVVTYPANPNATFGMRMRSLQIEDPATIRAAYRALVEERAGDDITPAKAKRLRAQLESLAAEDVADDAFTSLRQLVATLRDSTPVEPTDPVEPATTDPADAPAAEPRSSARVRAARARLELLRHQ